MSKKDYYQILGVDRSASSEQIKQAYRKLAFEYHPDRNQNPAMHEKMKEINEAYAVLSNEPRRKEYDFLRSQYGSFASDRYRQSHSNDDIFHDTDINQIFEEFSRKFGFRSFNDIFRESYPRIVLISQRIYMLYTDHNHNPFRVAMASIGLADFLNRHWKKWEKHNLNFPYLRCAEDNLLEQSSAISTNTLEDMAPAGCAKDNL
jgi:curved DNA-binding protein CbpA